jgi:acyl-CoA thioesterase FadM
VDQVKNTSMHMRHTVLDEAQECVADMLDILVMFDYRNHAKQPIPAVFREKMQPGN